jgi:hypothetical protein
VLSAARALLQREIFPCGNPSNSIEIVNRWRVDGMTGRGSLLARLVFARGSRQHLAEQEAPHIARHRRGCRSDRPAAND